jgi:FtsZ-interacting cell division protein YlmF
MSINASDLATKKKKKISSVVIAFLCGVFVGSVVVSLVVVNYYAGSSISQSKLTLEQQQHYQHQHQHQRQQRRQQQQNHQPQQQQQQQQQQQLRNDRSSTSITVEKEDKHIPATTISNNTFDGGIEKHSSIEKPPQESKQQINFSSSILVKEPPSFFELARQTGTDKVKGIAYLPSCLEDDSTCTRPSCEREKCRPWGHFYHTMYQQKFSKFLNSNESFQLLEIGYVRYIL